MYKRSAIAISLINDAAYHTDIDLDTVEDLNQFCYPISYDMHVLRKVHFLYAKNLPAELPWLRLATAGLD